MNKDEARCTTFKEMKFNDKVIDMPFKCNPTNPKIMCELYFNIHEDDQKDATIVEYLKTRNKGDNKCRCALDGKQNNGYCSSLVGTDMYSKAIQAHHHMMSGSSCHTMDRYNTRAQKDQKCGIGSYSNDFRFAVDKMFNVTYWPYIQKEETFKCIRRFFSDSYDSLILTNALTLRAAAMTAAASIALLAI